VALRNFGELRLQTQYFVGELEENGAVLLAELVVELVLDLVFIKEVHSAGETAKLIWRLVGMVGLATSLKFSSMFSLKKCRWFWKYSASCWLLEPLRCTLGSLLI